MPTSLAGRPLAGVVDQDLAHGAGRLKDDPGMIGVRVEPVRAEESEPDFVEQGSRLKSMIGSLASHGSRRQAVQFRTELIEEVIRRRGIASINLGPHVGHLALPVEVHVADLRRSLQVRPP
jgi:hypothetical protein